MRAMKLFSTIKDGLKRNRMAMLYKCIERWPNQIRFCPPLLIKQMFSGIYLPPFVYTVRDILFLLLDPIGSPMNDIIDTAVAAGTFKTLAAAVTAAGLVDTLKGAGPFTVFAPSDEAFAKLPAGTVEALLKDIPKLKSILTYHVVAGKVMAADVVGLNGKTAKTVNGADVAVSTEGGVKLNKTTAVVTTDIECTNGVIHIIDSVLMPA